MMILRIIKKTIEEYNLIEKNDIVLVGLSGGADSVCLTHALYCLKYELGIKLYTAHLNHGIRGAEAERDEEFAKNFSERLGIECFVKHADIPFEAKKSGRSEEAEGRLARYSFFETLCREKNITKIATAHNKNDNAETLLMNFMRGSSLGGLSGIPFKRGNIVRPLINVQRDEIEQYCRVNNLEYVTDSTNLADDYTRNKIRHTFIPLIQNEFNSNFMTTVTENASLIKDDSEYLANTAEKLYKENVKNNSIDCTSLLKMHMSMQRRVVRLMLKNAYGTLGDIPSKYTEDILSLAEKESGKSINLLGDVTARNEYGKLIIEKKITECEPFSYEIQVGTTIPIPELNCTAEAEYTDKKENDGAIYLSCPSGEENKIIIRSRKAGDKFSPVGMSGTKKVKQYFIDKKIPRDKRQLVPIIEIDGCIASVGDRADKKFMFCEKGIRIKFKNI